MEFNKVIRERYACKKFDGRRVCRLYTSYKGILSTRRKRYAQQIVALSDKIMKA